MKLSYLRQHHGLYNWLTEPLIKEEFDKDVSQSCIEFVTTDYNELSQEALEHRARKQLKSTALVCEECDKSFSRLDSLRRHEKLYCRVKSKRKCCRYCGEEFEKPLYLHDHIKRVHASSIKTERAQ
ncbi:hypothetical protein HN011_006184 [Eciton burchellii]|nr:hypothetical protein HN011_006184 [Eciton burchellii]